MKGNAKNAVLSELRSHKNKEFAAHHAKFFQTHRGGYGEGDSFWGLKVPQQRKISKKYYKDVNLDETEHLLQNGIHEVRLTALFILVEKYKRASVSEKEEIAELYIRNAKYINNWDLVDLSAPNILGEHWFGKNGSELRIFAKSGDLWKERIALLATLYFIRQNEFGETLALAKYLLNHKHDLIHKAAGWMLREAGKRDAGVLYSFLDKHYKKMPRTMLRYSLEKVPEKKRKHYMER